MVIVKNRTLLFSNKEQYIGTPYDNYSTVRLFSIKRVSIDGVDIAHLSFHVNIKRENDSEDTDYLEKEVLEDEIILKWAISENIFSVPGTAFISLRGHDATGAVKWGTYMAPVYVGDMVDLPELDESKLTELERLEAKFDILQETEVLRVLAEEMREKAEEERCEAESEREDAEVFRKNAESERVAAEKQRAAAEAERKEAEELRENTESERVAAEKQRAAAEAERKEAEELRKNAESERVVAELTRMQAEEDRNKQTSEVIGQFEETLTDMDKKVKMAQSWCEGGTDAREGEETDNAKYYNAQAGLARDAAEKAAEEMKTAIANALVDYVSKNMMSDEQINDKNKVPTSALVFAMNEALAQLKGELLGDLANKQVTEEYIANLGFWKESEGKEYVDTKVAELNDNLPNDETLIDNVAEVVKTELPLVKTAEQPTPANDASECIDTSKVYLLPDGYLYVYEEKTSYNLFKISEVSYLSRLQDDVEGIVESTTANIVTGWIPVTYGKYYALSALSKKEDGARIVKSATNTTNPYHITRMNGRKTDGTVVVWGKDFPLYNTKGVLTMPSEDIVEVQIHVNASNACGSIDISTSDNLAAIEPMFVEGDTADEAYNNAMTLEYISGDVNTLPAWKNTGLMYNQPADYEDRIVKLETDVSELQEKTKELEETMVNPVSTSPYYRDVDFGVVPFTYYQGVADSYEKIFGQTTDYATFIESWKSLVADHSSYVAETALGVASDGQTVYLYDFNPVRITNQKKEIPKVIIVACQHGFEKSNVYGLYYFVDNLLNRWNKHPALGYLRNHVELMIIPVLNTYGFDNLTYVNGNGVNLNRNYDSNWVLLDDTTSVQYGGTEPFDQTETQMVRDLLNSNTDALLVVDFHTNGKSSVAQYSYINYYGICKNTDDYYNRMVDAVAYQLSSISGNFNLDYELGQSDTILGFLNNSNGTGLLRDWATDNNFVGVLVEGFNGFPNDTPFVGKVYKANEEILVNWLIVAMNYLSK